MGEHKPDIFARQIPVSLQQNEYNSGGNYGVFAIWYYRHGWLGTTGLSQNIMTNLEINTPQYFRDTVETLLKRNENYSGTLEEYLRALWALVDQSRQMEPSWSAFLSLLEKAFSTAPTDFDPNWLVYEQPLDWGYVDGVYVLNKLENHKIMIVERNVSPFRILEHTLLFEIADLYRMRDDQLKLPHAELYLGITSPTKNAWYNFHVGSFLECATSPMNGNTQPLSSCSWVDLAEILTLGRLYE